MSSDAQQPVSVGLGGDGDEVDAIEDVERKFDVKLDDADATGWFTAGDVFKSLQQKVDGLELEDADQWLRFATALTQSTGVNPLEIVPESPLLAPPLNWGNAITTVGWLYVLAGIGAVVFVAALSLQ